MNGQCFHHDDLDDLFNSNFVKKHFWSNKNKERDFLIAFKLNNPNQCKFPNISNLLQLETNKFIKFWLKPIQLNEENDEEKEQWIKNTFFQLNSKELTFITDNESKIEELEKELKKLKKEMNKIEIELNKNKDKKIDETKLKSEDLNKYFFFLNNNSKFMAINFFN